MGRATYTTRRIRRRRRGKMYSHTSSAHTSVTPRNRLSPHSSGCPTSISATPRSSGCATPSAARGKAGDDANDFDNLLGAGRPYGLQHFNGDFAGEGDAHSV